MNTNHTPTPETTDEWYARCKMENAASKMAAIVTERDALTARVAELEAALEHIAVVWTNGGLTATERKAYKRISELARAALKEQA